LIIPALRRAERIFLKSDQHQLAAACHRQRSQLGWQNMPTIALFLPPSWLAKSIELPG
jgi:hypothetical protein